MTPQQKVAREGEWRASKRLGERGLSDNERTVALRKIVSLLPEIQAVRLPNIAEFPEEYDIAHRLTSLRDNGREWSPSFSLGRAAAY